MRNRMYGGVRGRKTKVERKLLRFPPTRLIFIFVEDLVFDNSIIVFIPKRNNVSEPTNEKMLIINSICIISCDFAAKILQFYDVAVATML